MPRRLLSPGWLALHALTAVLVLVMAWLGWWQLGRAQPTPPAAPAAPAPLEQLAVPRQAMPPDAVGRQATARGTYDGTRQLLVAEREQGGRPGYWLLTPLRLDDGAAVPVVRGWVASPDDRSAAPPAGPVVVTGILLPSEVPGPPATNLLAGQLATVTTSELVSLLPYSLYDGYLLLAEQSPSPGPAPDLVPPPAPRSAGLHLQNLAYAFQWWLFALFTVFIWWRLLRDRQRDSLTGRTTDEPADNRGVTA